MTGRRSATAAPASLIGERASSRSVCWAWSPAAACRRPAPVRTLPGWARRVTTAAHRSWFPRAGGTVTVALDQLPTTLNDHTVAGDTPAGRMLGSAVWAQVFRVGPGLTPQLDTNVVDSAEVISLSPQTVVYQIDPQSDVVRRGAHQRRRLHLRLAVAARRRHRRRRDARTRWPRPSGTATSRRSRARTAGEPSPSCSTRPSPTGRRCSTTCCRRTSPSRWAGTTGSTTSPPASSCRAGPWQVVSWQPGRRDRARAQPPVVGESRQSRPGRGAGRRRTPRCRRRWARIRCRSPTRAASTSRSWPRCRSSSVLQTQAELGTTHAPARVQRPPRPARTWPRSARASPMPSTGPASSRAWASPRTTRCGRTTTTSSPTASPGTPTMPPATRKWTRPLRRACSNRAGSPWTPTGRGRRTASR